MPSDSQSRLDHARQEYEALPEEERAAFMERLERSDPKVVSTLMTLVGKQSSEPAEVDLTHSDEGLTPDFEEASTVLSPGVPTHVGRYRLEEEVGRGGMGVVLRAHDPQFDRTLAVKMMLPEAARNKEARDRFLDEAKLTGRLQHPGIPPAHELGELEDGTPYFAMKLIKGRTLAKLLKEREPGPDTQMLGVFTQICHTVGYAHSRGVIHRDLKPGNVMVGAHGEVQVMDWGLAKLLSELARAEERVIGSDTVRSLKMREDHALSQTGDVMGTPAYMAPEQARGEIRSLDPRCDVFGLGAILCEILTGSPAFRGPRAMDLILQSVEGNLSDALGRLDQCGADAELVALCKRCLSADKGERPEDAMAVAEAVEAYEAALQARLRQAEVAQARAEVKAVEERKRRRWTLLASAAVMLLIVGGAGGWVWYRGMSEAREAEQVRREGGIRDALGQAERIREGLSKELKEKGGVFKLLDTPEDWSARIKAAESARARARDLALEREVSAELTQRIAEMKGLLAQDRADHKLATELETIREESAVLVEGSFDVKGALHNYERAFKEAGIDVFGQPLERVVRLLRASAIRVQIASGLDDWAFNVRGKTLEETRKRRARLLAIARGIDPDPWKDRLRQPKHREDGKGLAALRDEGMQLPEKERAERLTPQIYQVLGHLLEKQGQESEAWLRQGQSLHPSDFWLAFNLGSRLVRTGKNREAIRFYGIALARRPKSPATHNNLGQAHYNNNDLADAIRHYEKAINLDRRNAKAHYNLGLSLRGKNDLAGAIRHYERALELDPQFAPPHHNLGNALQARNDLAGAIRHYERALELDPNYVEAHASFGFALQAKKDLEGAIRHYERALELDSKHGLAHTKLGLALYDKGDLAGAIRHYEKALELDSNNVAAHAGFGVALLTSKNFASAVRHLKKATELDPKHAFAHLGLGLALRSQGELAEAIKAFENADRLLDPRHPIKPGIMPLIQETIRWNDLKTKLPALLVDKEAKAGDRIDAAGLCLLVLRQYHTAARLYQAAFAAEPELAGALENGHRYNAVCAASMASSDNEVQLTDKERAALRDQALAWLCADLQALRERLKDPKQQPGMQQTLRHWQKTPDFVGIREADALAKLPEEERKKWQQLWKEVAEVLKQAE